MTPSPDRSQEEAPIPDFNRTHLHILQILWDAEGALKPAQIEERFDWPIENATLRSVLALMLDGGELEREKRGKAYHYFTRKPKSATAGDMLSGLARIFGAGSRVGLLSQLFRENSLSEAEIEQLRALAEASRTPDPSKANHE